MRDALSDPAGWRYIPDVVDDPGRCWAILHDEVAWTDQMRARRTASMGRPYNYAGATYPEAPWHPVVADLARQLEPLVEFRPTNCLLNLYPSGDHRIGWHADDVSILAPGTGIAIVSLGAVRTLQLRAGEPPAFSYVSLPLAAGSLLWMSQGLQATHKHGIKREVGAGPRLSLTFRRIIHQSPPVERPRWGDAIAGGESA